VSDTEVTSGPRYWLKEIASALTREKLFRKVAKEAVSLYECEKAEQAPYNILYSNTETMSPALYNSTPRPDVDRRFKDGDKLGLMAARLLERALKYQIDNSDSEDTPFDNLVESAVKEALVPGRGLTWFKYDADVEKTEDGQERVKSEYVFGEEVPWDRFCHGYGKKWKDVPWIAREHAMTPEEVAKNFGKGAAAGLEFSTRRAEEESTEAKGMFGTRDAEAENVKLATVWEIWDKRTRKVYFVSPNNPNAFLKELDDPLNLKRFFPCPKPLIFFEKISGCLPGVLYETYLQQAQELNVVTTRINRITRALRVRGFYDSSIEGLDKVLAADDNTMIPIENAAMYSGQGMSLDKAIWLMPIEKLVTVLQQLYDQRQAIKQVIFEITGIADIMRGSTQASETLGAQQLKNQWGTLRLKRAQKAVASYVRDCLRIMAEITVHKMSAKTLAAMTGMNLPTSQQKEMAQQALQQLQMAQQMGQAPAPGPTAQEFQRLLDTPSWEEVMGLLQDDLLRCYRIDIETNSTVDAEATEDKQDITEVMQAMGQFFSAVGPLVEKGVMDYEIAKNMLLVIVRRFRFGREFEEAVEGMQPPAPPQNQDEQAAQKAAAEAAMMTAQAKIAEIKAKAEATAQKHQDDMEMQRMKMDLERQKHALELQKIQQQAAAQIAVNQSAPAGGPPANPSSNAPVKKPAQQRPSR